MKYLNTFLLLLVLFAVCVNFYRDEQRYRQLSTQVKEAAAPVQMPASMEAGPFDRPVTEQSISNEDVPKGPQTSIQFSRITHEFGTIAEGKVYSTTFKFTNTGSNNLIISEAIGSCGCTVPTWPKEPVKPGETAEIKVEFDAKGRDGKQTKTVTVTSNTIPSKNVLTITSNVIPR